MQFEARARQDDPYHPAETRLGHLSPDTRRAPDAPSVGRLLRRDRYEPLLVSVRPCPQGETATTARPQHRLCVRDSPP
eukprot:8959984-Alexandrium_andersonii.AAC.1